MDSFWEALSPEWDMTPLKGDLCGGRSAVLQKRFEVVAGEKTVLQAQKMRQSFSCCLVFTLPVVVHPPWLKKVHSDQVAQDHIQACFEYLKKETPQPL